MMSNVGIADVVATLSNWFKDGLESTDVLELHGASAEQALACVGAVYAVDRYGANLNSTDPAEVVLGAAMQFTGGFNTSGDHNGALDAAISREVTGGQAAACKLAMMNASDDANERMVARALLNIAQGKPAGIPPYQG